jgi:hypothetical protein
VCLQDCYFTFRIGWDRQQGSNSPEGAPDFFRSRFLYMYPLSRLSSHTQDCLCDEGNAFVFNDVFSEDTYDVPGSKSSAALTTNRKRQRGEEGVREEGFTSPGTLAAISMPLVQIR